MEKQRTYTWQQLAMVQSAWENETKYKTFQHIKVLVFPAERLRKSYIKKHPDININDRMITKDLITAYKKIKDIINWHRKTDPTFGMKLPHYTLQSK
jgi:hypothetical protein